MKPRLHAALGQHLAMTPQLQQAIRLLQMPVTELATELAEAVASNPLLEWAGDEAPAMPPTDSPADGHSRDQARHSDDAGPDVSTYAGSSHSDDADTTDPTARLTAGTSLQEHVRWQLHLRPLPPPDQAIGAALTDALDADGYLRVPLEEIAETLLPDWQVSTEQILAVLRLIQDMEPAGLGARDLAECLLLQLREPSASVAPDVHALAIRIARECLPQLPRLGVDGIARLLKAPTAMTASAIELLRTLDPRPGRAHATTGHDDHLLPDIVIYRHRGQWQARLGAHAGPPVTLNQHYTGLIGACSDSDANYLRGHLQQARWLIKGLEARGQTLLRVAQSLIRHQSAFLEFGDQALHPLTLRELAGELDLHESTISRAVAGKYAHTPRGTLPLRQFFSQGVGSSETNETSGTAIQATLRQLVEAENPRKPLSDAKLVTLLNEAGITVARRTVAKYREAMSIPPSHERVRMG